MTRFTWSRDWRRFFGDQPYPFDLDLVEARDGDDGRGCFVAAELGPTRSRILDLGCGYGRHMATLSSRGHAVFGVDLSLQAVVRANSRLAVPTAIVASAEELPFVDGAFDAAVSLYTSLGYAGTSTARLLQEAARVVRPGGLLVVDVANGERSQRSVGVERVPGGLGAWLRYGTRTAVRQRNVVVSADVIGLFGFAHQRFTAARLVHEVSMAGGWTVRTVYGDFNGGDLSECSTRIVVVACRHA